jgi:hypothetical protein
MQNQEETFIVSWIPFDDVTCPEYEEEFDTFKEAMKYALMRLEDGDNCISVSDSKGEVATFE